MVRTYWVSTMLEAVVVKMVAEMRVVVDNVSTVVKVTGSGMIEIAIGTRIVETTNPGNTTVLVLLENENTVTSTTVNGLKTVCVKDKKSVAKLVSTKLVSVMVPGPLSNSVVMMVLTTVVKRVLVTEVLRKIVRIAGVEMRIVLMKRRLMATEVVKKLVVVTVA